MNFHTIRFENTLEKRSWFIYYKFRPDDPEELYVPAPYGTAEFSEGDVAWLCVGNEVYGGVPILRVVDDALNQRKELWYRGTDIKVLRQPMSVLALGLGQMRDGRAWAESDLFISTGEPGERTSDG